MHATLVDAQILHAHLDDPEWVIVDCRHALADVAFGRRAYEEAHVPGAHFADVEHDLSGTKTATNGRHPLPDPQAFAAFLRSLGVNSSTQLVAYDAGGDMFAARLWFLARWIGHDAVAVLDGGVAAWRAHGYPLTSAPSTTRTLGNVGVAVRSATVVDAAFVRNHLHAPGVRILDARGADRFRGENETVDPVAGHIPGALNRPFKENFTESLSFKPAEELRAVFAAFGPPDSIVHQCGSGVSACANALAMEVAGLSGSRLYAGSWSEWISDPSRPVEVE